MIGSDTPTSNHVSQNHAFMQVNEPPFNVFSATSIPARTHGGLTVNINLKTNTAKIMLRKKF